MARMEFISFDLDGTLIDLEFSEIVWHYGVPELYAQNRGIEFVKAKDFVIKEYQKVGDQNIEWYDIRFWFHHFDLSESWQEFIQRFRHKITVYPEVEDVLKNLSKKHKLIVISNSAREFVELGMETSGLRDYFTHVFSATSDFKQVKKSSQFYSQICNALKIEARELTHVGDHWEFDYLAPRNIGINSFYLDRTGEKKEGFIINNLRDLEERLTSC
jgi:putative hydrolase of the HAD superfamily